MFNRNAEPDCKCNSRYYNEDLMGINTCKECPERYQECDDPSTPRVSCRGSNRKDMITNDCVCLDNHYEDDDSENCIPCQYPCLECDSLTHCNTCDGAPASRNSDPDCYCISRYYNEDVMGVNTYKECPERYQECDDSTTPKLGCRGSNRKDMSTHDCVCQDNHYEDDNSENCLPCQYLCLECDSLTHCLSCDGFPTNRNSDPDCKCISRYYNEDVMGVNTCKECPDRYQECDDPVSPKVGCRGKNRQIMVNDCLCQPQYYEDSESEHCIACIPPCQNCSSQHVCLDCLDSNLEAPQCRCSKGFYIDPDQPDQCNKCLLKFKECISYEDGICRNLQNTDQNCNCLEGYFLDKHTLTCLKFQHYCSSYITIKDTGEQQCNECSHETRENPPTCDCIQGYVNDGMKAQCIIKPKMCTNCASIVASGPKNEYMLEFYLNKNKVSIQDTSSNNQGFLIVVIGDDGESVQETKKFNVVQSEQAVQEMVDFIKQLPEGQQVLIGGQQLSDLSKLTPEFYQAIKSLGASDDIEKQLKENTILAMQGEKGKEMGMANFQIQDENDADQNLIQLLAPITLCYQYNGQCYENCPIGTQTIQEKYICKDVKQDQLEVGIPMIIAIIMFLIAISVIIWQVYKRYKRRRKVEQIQNLKQEIIQYENDVQKQQSCKSNNMENISSVISLEDQKTQRDQLNCQQFQSILQISSKRTLKSNERNSQSTCFSSDGQNSSNNNLTASNDIYLTDFQTSPIKKSRRRARKSYKSILQFQEQDTSQINLG